MLDVCENNEINIHLHFEAMHEESQRGVKTLASMPASQLKVIERSELFLSN